jgi:Mg-chelatase subunit ChlD
VKLQPLKKEDLIRNVKAIHPKGQTPIAGSIRLAVDQLKALEEETTIILISDGKETCDPDPCAAVRQLKDVGIKFILHVIGFDVSAEEGRQLECLAEAGGGIYVPASSAEKLDEALRVVTEPPAKPLPKIQENIEIILDTSAAMRKPFEGRTKLEAAVKGLNKVLDLQVAGRDNLAFRQFGGPCRGQNTRRLVDFGQSNAGPIRAALATLNSDGETATAAAVSSAARDFDDPRFDGVQRRGLIITGGQDSCNPRAADDIRRALQSKRIRPDFWFIGMDVPPDQQRQLSEIQKATGGRPIFFVKNQNELESTLERLFEVEPVRADIKSMIDILNSVIHHFNKFGDLIEQKSYEEAGTEIREAFDKLKKTELPFQDLGKRLTREDFRKLYEFSSTNRDLLEIYKISF